MATPIGTVFTNDTFSRDYTLEVFKFLNGDEIHSLSSVNRFCNNFVKTSDIWNVIYKQNMKHGKFVLREVAKWTANNHT